MPGPNSRTQSNNCFYGEMRSVEQNNTKTDTKGDHANEVIKIPKKEQMRKRKGSLT